MRGDLPAGTLRVAAVAAGVACVPLSLALGRRAGAAHLAAVGSALAYDLGVKGTALSFAPYAVSFGLLPEVVALASPAGRPARAWAPLAGALLGVGAHLANALPDLEDDLATGVRGLPHRLGRTASGALAAGSLLLATVVLVTGPGRPGRPGAATVALAGAVTATGLVRGRRPGSRAPFLAALVVAGADVALLLTRGARLTGG